MQIPRLTFMALLLAATLSGCATASRPYPPSDTTAGSSGVTVYGEIDASVGRVR